MKSIRGNLCFVSLAFVNKSSALVIPLMFYILIIKYHCCQLFYWVSFATVVLMFLYLLEWNRMAGYVIFKSL